MRDMPTWVDPDPGQSCQIRDVFGPGTAKCLTQKPQMPVVCCCPPPGLSIQHAMTDTMYQDTMYPPSPHIHPHRVLNCHTKSSDHPSTNHMFCILPSEGHDAANYFKGHF